jgi:hypothetical protein
MSSEAIELIRAITDGWSAATIPSAKTLTSSKSDNRNVITRPATEKSESEITIHNFLLFQILGFILSPFVSYRVFTVIDNAPPLFYEGRAGHLGSHTLY